MTPHLHARRTLALLAAGALAAALLAGCGDDGDDVAASGGDEPAAAVTVADAWARPSPAVVDAGAAYLTVTNDGDEDDALVGVTVDEAVAGTAELHETVTEDGMTTTTGMEGGDMEGGGMMTMRPVDEIPLPAGETVALEPGGFHVMLLELVAPLEAGTEIAFTLELESGGALEVVAPVRDDAP